ncbi:hypothetical protein PT974_03071 [Cladobotryum mycophilum]|uniref:Zn(2)-C6 fungal-type domain-containing protein n=1 Tax=Cladobotryum mycophilum TaxID=491253 RepID=A0ABR0SX18_9HYPO
MVFSGRPSTACHACRPKRLKCDRVQPGCTQCWRKGVTCPGYRDPSALRVRDETCRIAHKAEKSKKLKASSLILPNDAVEKSLGCADLSTYWTCPIPRSAGTLLQESRAVANTYFMTSYIVCSPFESYVPIIYRENPLIDDALSAAISATSLAILGQRVGCSKYIDIARREYSMALTRTNNSLADPESAILDRTLAAVLVLGLFEAVVFAGGQSPTSWTAHTLGAMQLLYLRGKEQFKSNIAHKLFAQVSNNIRTSCIQRSVTIPPQFLAFHDEVKPLLDKNDFAMILAPIIDKVASLRARTINDPNPKLLQEALDVDNDIVAFTNSLECGMQYTPRPQDEIPSWAYLQTAHRYPHIRIAKFWNAIRMIRMFLITFISDSVSGEMDLTMLSVPEDAGCKDDYIEYLRNYGLRCIAEVALEVLASVPDFIEPYEFNERFCPAGRTLVWPLSILQKCPTCPKDARDHALLYLDRLARDLNMPQAVHPSRQPGSKEDW